MENTERPVIVCTKNRFVFFGYTSDTSNPDVIKLRKAKMAIRFGTSRGIMQLAKTGPTDTSKISDPADTITYDITAIFNVTTEAERKWNDA